MILENFQKTDYIVGKLRENYIGIAYSIILSGTFWHRKPEWNTGWIGARAQRWEG